MVIRVLEQSLKIKEVPFYLRYLLFFTTLGVHDYCLAIISKFTIFSFQFFRPAGQDGPFGQSIFNSKIN